MTKNISEEELLLRKRARRRLVGAIVLVILSVIILPMIFDEPKTDKIEKQEMAINLPPQRRNAIVEPPPLPNEQLISKEALEKLTAPTESQSVSKNKPTADDDGAESLPERKRMPIPGIKPKFEKPAVEAKVTTNTSAPAPAPAPAPASIAAPASAVVTETPKNLVIQLGAFSDSAKAKQQLDGLIANGFNAYTESLKTANGEVTRVRIGPYTNRNTAESELKKLKKLGFEGVLTSR